MLDSDGNPIKETQTYTDITQFANYGQLKNNQIKDNVKFLAIQLDRQYYGKTDSWYLGVKHFFLSDLTWLRVLEFWLVFEQGGEQRIPIEKMVFYDLSDINIFGVAYVYFDPKLSIFYKIHKKIVLKYKQPVLAYLQQPIIVSRKPIELEIIRSSNSEDKQRISEIIKEAPKKELQTSEPVPTTIEKIGSVASTLTLASAAIFIRYFVVVDILINLFGKVNVELGPRIQKLVDLLKKLQFPSIGVAQSSSIIQDGGDDAIENREKFQENNKNKVDQKKEELDDLESQKKSQMYGKRILEKTYGKIIILNSRS